MVNLGNNGASQVEKVKQPDQGWSPVLRLNIRCRRFQWVTQVGFSLSLCVFVALREHFSCVLSLPVSHAFAGIALVVGPGLMLVWRIDWLQKLQLQSFYQPKNQS